MRQWVNLVGPGLFAALLTAAISVASPAHAQQAACATQNGSYTCTTSGTSTTNGFYAFQTGSPDTPLMTVTSNGNVSYGVTGGASVGLNFGSTATSGGTANGLQLTNYGTINLFQNAPHTGTPMGIRVQQAAGNGVSSGGSSLSGVTVTNENTITLTLPSLQVSDYASGIWATDTGGAGTNQYEGGTSAGVTIQNSGAISLTTTGVQGASGIQALSNGGNGGNEGGAGSNGGATSITNSAGVNVNWTWNGAGSSNLGLYGVQALSAGGGGGGGAGGTGDNDGAGGAGNAASVTVSLYGSVSVTENGAPPTGAPAAPNAGISASVIGGNGGEAAYGDNNDGGTGGSILGNAQVSVTDANVTTTGNQLPGILAYAVGGAGGAGGPPAGGNCGCADGWQDGGNGGEVDGSALVTVTTATMPVTISTVGANSPAVAAVQIAGAGGLGGSQARTKANGGTGGDGGNAAGGITINLIGSASNPLTVATNGTYSPGVYAISQGGIGGDSGEASGDAVGSAHSYNAGSGGAGGNVTVNLAATSIGTQADLSPGIVAISEGGVGGSSGSSMTGTNKSDTGDGGSGGNTGAVAVTLDAASSIATQGADSIGVLAQTSSGGGGYAGGYNGVKTSGGTGGAGGNGGNVSVTSAATISTQGQTARGILAQALAGSGGAGSSGWAFKSDGGHGANGGIVGSVSVTNSGAISTAGSSAQGVLEQSIGGSGGAGGSASGFVSVGGDASDNPFTSDGNAVSFTSDGGRITTTGQFGFGLLAQSIGGGGGDGGGATGITVAVGGNGGQGGGGGAVSAQLDGGAIATSGDIAPGLVLQSIGGGGGNGGNATSTGITATVALGGAGGEGGAGGGVTFTSSDTNVTTVGTLSPGLIVQSIGGGGGNGGNAMGGAVGPGFASTTTIGGSGGDGSYGNVVQATVAGGLIATGQNPFLVQGGTINTENGTCTAQSGASFVCTQMPVDDFGVVVQSIGGGGGTGGSAIAQSVAIAVPIPGTGTQVGVSATVALGGTGGSGGQGNEADFSLSNGGAIKTMGQSSTAIVVQSIGGGGGNGGATSAASTVLGYGSNSVPEGSYQVGVEVNVTEGGTGGSGGTGGPVNVAIGGTVTNTSNYITNGAINPAYTAATIAQDPSGSAPTAIITYNDYADGVLAQSIGGGGGNAAVGSGNTQDFGTKTTAGLNLSLGSSGGGGGAAGAVTVDLFPGNGITTYGSGAVGIIAQSIGGGGGTSQGSSIDPVAGTGIGDTTYKPGMKINLGTGTWGSHSSPTSGGTGGAVTVNVAAPITTYGGDATGVLVQSIGGGGGMAGGSGADASADNPIVAALNAQESTINNVNTLADNSSTTIDPTLAVSIGGTGGSGNTGGAATANIYSAITTSGDWANGVVVQSIGGGGGKGGTAVATGSGGTSETTINLDYALGGSGGSGGDGGAATVNLYNQATIQTGMPYVAGNNAGTTAGFGAAGVVVQSLGGGGGMGADGSDSATGDLSLGSGNGGHGGASGSGGAATLVYQTTYGASISTNGQFADGVVMQSIGGGGGMGGAGSSLFQSGWVQANTSLTLGVGGGSGASGDGGAVTFGPLASINPQSTRVPLAISTTGWGAFGILAQSIGGGGGVASAAPSASTVTPFLGGTNGASGNGGTVNVTLAAQTSISTTGAGAMGIVAQSIGGGGGIIRSGNSSDTNVVLSATPPTEQGRGSNGSGGSVGITMDGTVTTSGPGAVGIFAQSLGGGGGLMMDGNNTWYAGSPGILDGYSCGTRSGCAVGGPVDMLLYGSVFATGPNATAIFAQSSGYGPSAGYSNLPGFNTASGRIDIQVWDYQTVEGGSVGVWVDTPASSPTAYLTLVDANLYTAEGVNGMAAQVTGGGQLAVANDCFMYNGVNQCGTITGNLSLNGGQFSNGGVYKAGPSINANVVNSGTVSLAMLGQAGEFTSNLTGSFTQTGSGRLEVLVDSLHKRTTQLVVDGPAVVAGTISPVATTLLPGQLTVLTASTLASSAVEEDPLIFRWNLAQAANELTISPSSNFAPRGVSLTASESSLALYLTHAWNNADSAFATRFAALSQINDAGSYTTMLDAYSGKATEAQSLALINSAGSILGSAMSCPVFTDQSVLLGEGNCAWTKVTGRLSSQWGTDDTQGYHVSGASYRLGAQHEIAPNWYLGGSFAVGQTWATTNSTASGNSSGYGQTYDGSVALKYTMGRWLFASSVALAEGAFHSNRLINIPGANLSLQSDPRAFLAGGRVRAGYEIPFDDWYVRPYGDLDLLYSSLPGFRESGPALYALDVRGSSKTSVAISPMVEVGGRVALDETTILRPFAAVGVSFLPDNMRSIDASFVGAAPEDGTFRSFLNSPNVVGNVELGAQLYRAGGFEVKAEYDATIGSTFLSQSASARLAYHF